MTKTSTKNPKEFKTKARKLLRFLTNNELLLRQEIRSEIDHITFLEKTASSLTDFAETLRTTRDSNLKQFFSSKISRCQTLRTLSPNSTNKNKNHQKILKKNLSQISIISAKIKSQNSKKFGSLRRTKKSKKFKKNIVTRSQRVLPPKKMSDINLKNSEKTSKKKSYKVLVKKLKNIGMMGTIKASRLTSYCKEPLSREIKRAKNRSEVRKKISERIDVLVSKFDNYAEPSYSYFKDTNDYIETDSIVEQVKKSGQKKKIQKNVDSIFCENEDDGDGNEKIILGNAEVLSFDDDEEVENKLGDFVRQSPMMNTNPCDGKVRDRKQKRLSLDLNSSNNFLLSKSSKMKKKGKKVDSKNIKFSCEEDDTFYHYSVPKLQIRREKIHTRDISIGKGKKYYSFKHKNRNLKGYVSYIDHGTKANENNIEGKGKINSEIFDKLEKRKQLLDRLSLELAELQEI